MLARLGEADRNNARSARLLTAGSSVHRTSVNRQYDAPGRVAGRHVSSVGTAAGCRSQNGSGSQPGRYYLEPECLIRVPALGGHINLLRLEDVTRGGRPARRLDADIGHPDGSDEDHGTGLTSSTFKSRENNPER